MTATVIKYPIKIQMECSGCGASFNAPCDCGMSYVPAETRAKKAVETIQRNPTVLLPLNWHRQKYRGTGA